MENNSISNLNVLSFFVEQDLQVLDHQLVRNKQPLEVLSFIRRNSNVNPLRSCCPKIEIMFSHDIENLISLSFVSDGETEDLVVMEGGAFFLGKGGGNGKKKETQQQEDCPLHDTINV